MDKVKKIKIKKLNDSLSEYLPIGVDAKDVDMQNGNNLEEELYGYDRVFDSIAEMISNEKRLAPGMSVRTLGYYKVNDGGAAEYKITNVKSDIDYQEKIRDGLYATLIIKNQIINVEQFGCYGDSIHDDKTNMQKAIDYGSSHDLIILLNKRYLISNPITITGKNGFVIKGNGHQDSITLNNNIKADNGFLIINQVIKASIENLSIATKKTAIIIEDSKGSQFLTIDKCQIRSDEIGIECKGLYYSRITNTSFNNCKICIKVLTGSGDIKIDNCKFNNLNNPLYIDTGSDVLVTNCCCENVATFLYQKHGLVNIDNCYVGDGIRQFAIVENGKLIVSNQAQTILTYPSTKNPSVYDDRIYCIRMKNKSSLYLNNIEFDSKELNNPIIILDDSSIMFINNVRFLGYNLLETTQKYIQANRKENYITSRTLTGSSPSNFNVSSEIVGTNYMGHPIIKYTNTSGTNRFRVRFNYKVKKAGYYLLYIKFTSNDDYEYLSFQNGCEYIKGIPENLYKHRINNNYTINPGSENIIRPALKTYPGSYIVVPIYIDEAHINSYFDLSSRSEILGDTKTIEFVGLVNFENAFELPCWF